MKKFSFILIALLVIGSMLLASCKPAAEQPAEEAPAEEAPAEEAPVEEEGPTEADKMGGTLNLGSSAVVQFDPPFINDNPSSYVVSQMHAFLFRVVWIEGVQTPVPDLAKSWDIEEEGKVIVFHLNEGWTFHDGNDIFPEGEGREVTAEDVAYSIDRMVTLEGSSAPADLMSNYDSVEVIDDYTVKLILKNADAILFSGGRGLSGTAILPKEAVDARGEDWGLNPIGAGPFEFVEYVPDDHLILRRNEDFATTPYLDEVYFKIIPDEDVMAISLEAGDIDYMGISEYSVFEQFEGNPDFKFYSSNSPYSFNIQFDLKNELFQDMNVRKAIAHAVDGRAIMKNEFGGMFVEGCGIAGPGVPGFDPDMCDKYFTYDTSLTEQLMTESGWAKNGDGIWEKDGQTFTVDFEVWNLSPAPSIATAATTQMKEAGFDVTMVEVEFGTWIEDALGENTQKPLMMWSGFCCEGGMDSYWGRNGLAPAWGFDNEEVFGILEQANVMFDPDARWEVLMQAHNAIYSSYADIPLGFATGYDVTTSRVEDFIIWGDLLTSTNNVWLSSK